MDNRIARRCENCAYCVQDTDLEGQERLQYRGFKCRRFPPPFPPVFHEDLAKGGKKWDVGGCGEHQQRF
jgi:hypothetical protein